MRIRYQLIILTVATILCYVNTWKNSFVYDDHTYVEQNALITGPLDLKKIFTSSYPPQSPDQGLYRPMLTLSYKVDDALWGMPKSAGVFNGFHLVNTLMHLGTVILVFFLIQRLGIAEVTAFFAALLFAVHPLLTESVGWVVGRAELGAALWTLAAVHLRMSGSKKYRLLATLAWLTALLFKESAIMAPALVLILERFFPNRFPKLRRPERVTLIVTAVLTLCIYLGLRSMALPSLVPSVTPFEGVATPVQRVCTAVMLLWKYLWYVFIPIPLSVFHDVRPATGPGDIRFLMACAGWAILAGSLIRWTRQTRFWRLGLAWWFIDMIPVSNLLVPIGTVFAERFLYLPGVFLYVALVESIRQWMKANDMRPLAGQIWSGAAAVTVLMVICTYAITSVFTFKRNEDWKNDVSLWESAVSNYPESFVAAAPYAEALLHEGRFEQAMVYLKSAESGVAQVPKPYQKIFIPKLDRLRSRIQQGIDRKRYFNEMKAGRKLVIEGQPRAGLKVFQALAKKYPQYSEGEEAVGDVYFKLGNDIGALQHYQDAILIEPDRAALFGKLAQTLARMGASDKAIEMYERSLVLNPNDPIANYNLAVLWNDIGQLDRAIFYMQRAVDAYPAFVAARLNLASFYEKKKRNEDARKQVQEVLKIDAQNPEAQKIMRRLGKQATRE